MFIPAPSPNSMFDSIVHWIDGIVVAAVVGMTRWLFTLGTRVSVIETRHDDLKELIETKFDAMDDRLDRIERALNGALRH